MYRCISRRSYCLVARLPCRQAKILPHYHQPGKSSTKDFELEEKLGIYPVAISVCGMSLRLFSHQPVAIFLPTIFVVSQLRVKPHPLDSFEVFSWRGRLRAYLMRFMFLPRWHALTHLFNPGDFVLPAFWSVTTAYNLGVPLWRFSLLANPAQWLNHCLLPYLPGWWSLF